MEIRGAADCSGECVFGHETETFVNMSSLSTARRRRIAIQVGQ